MKQLIFVNRFFHDNLHKFSVKISEKLVNLQNQSDVYRFLFINEKKEYSIVVQVLYYANLTKKWIDKGKYRVFKKKIDAK